MSDATDQYRHAGFGTDPIGFGARPAILSIDFQAQYVDPQWPFGGRKLTLRAIETLLEVLPKARERGVPVIHCNTAYRASEDMPFWKAQTVRDQFIEGHPSTVLHEPLVDRERDIVITKTGASIFFQTPVAPYLVRKGVDTVIITGVFTSGCVRASAIDSFQWGFRTMVPEDCVGDYEEGPHNDNLRDVGRRYADVIDSEHLLNYFDRLSRSAPSG